ncbi:uncharacterized protein LOC125178423 [Hyalella azteca]|uniref:Uncharacterized protein LOC125178423 n=1 Tax=Hyalella azteca TaxID=294128 RepID=A0A979FM02_HYAAZ|nr:uncharacterized protein LOC125178423 [Hyalella azteca]
MKCLVQPACKAVTADADSTTGNASTCLYSKLAVTASVLLQSNQSKAVTFVKCQRAACAAPFREVEGVGCIYTSDRAATLQEAEQLCSGHSQQLYAPPTDAALKNLIKLMLNESQSTMGYWLGLKLIEGQTRSWQWFNGRTQTSETGQGFWIRTDPNNNETCARLAIHATKQNTTGLASTECDRDFNYVCQMHLCDEAY